VPRWTHRRGGGHTGTSRPTGDIDRDQGELLHQHGRVAARVNPRPSNGSAALLSSKRRTGRVGSRKGNGSAASLTAKEAPGGWVVGKRMGQQPP